MTENRWPRIYKNIEDFRTHMSGAGDLESKKAAVLVEIAVQLMELNGNIEDLVTATKDQG